MFHELEREPDLLFGSNSNLASLPNAAAADGASPSTSEAMAATAVLGEERVLLLRRPLRRFVQPVGRSTKLMGMVHVVGAASESLCPRPCPASPIFTLLTYPPTPALDHHD